MGARDALEAGTWVFADLERLGPAGRELAVALHDALLASGAPVRLLNDPAVALDRLPLPSALHAVGVNPFRAFRATDALPADLAFPVFVRLDGRGERVKLRLPARLVARARLERQDYLWRTRLRRGWEAVDLARARLAG